MTAPLRLGLDACGQVAPHEHQALAEVDISPAEREQLADADPGVEENPWAVCFKTESGMQARYGGSLLAPCSESSNPIVQAAGEFILSRLKAPCSLIELIADPEVAPLTLPAAHPRPWSRRT